MPNKDYEVEKTLIRLSIEKQAVQISEAMVMLPMIQLFNDFQENEAQGNIPGATRLAGMIEGILDITREYGMPGKKEEMEEIHDSIQRFYFHYKIGVLVTESSTSPEQVAEVLAAEGKTPESEGMRVGTVADVLGVPAECTLDEMMEDGEPTPISKLLH